MIADVNHEGTAHTSLLPMQPTAARQSPFESDRKKRICGLSKRVFWLLVIVAIMGVAAVAVGGGVAGSKSRNINSTSGTNTLLSTSSSMISASTASASIIQTSQPTPITTLSLYTVSASPSGSVVRDCPASNWTISSEHGTNHSTPIQLFRKTCGVASLNAYQAFSNNAAINVRVGSVDQCVQNCADYNNQNTADIRAGNTSIRSGLCIRIRLWTRPLVNVLGI